MYLPNFCTYLITHLSQIDMGTYRCIHTYVPASKMGQLNYCLINQAVIEAKQITTPLIHDTCLLAMITDNKHRL